MDRTEGVGRGAPTDADYAALVGGTPPPDAIGPDQTTALLTAAVRSYGFPYLTAEAIALLRDSVTRWGYRVTARHAELDVDAFASAFDRFMAMGAEMFAPALPRTRS